MNRGIKWLLIAVAGLISVGILISALFVIDVISKAPLERIEKVKVLPQKQGLLDSKVLLEEGALVRQSELETYFLFSKSIESFGDWLAKMQRQDFVSLNKNNYILEKEIHLHELLQNECPSLYCYQSRVPFERLPSIFWKGLIGIEDTRFLDHIGIDFKAMARAFFHDIKVMRFEQGASTLTQQLVKNLFYTSEKKISRKLKEIIVSIYIEMTFPEEEIKERILEAYFNEVEWGSLQGVRIKGVQAASFFYFSKKLNDLSPFEASILVSLLKGPYFYSPLNHLDRLKKRTHFVYKKLVSMHLLPGSAKDAWADRDWKRWQKQLIIRNSEKPFRSLWRSQKNKNLLFNDYENYVFVQKVNLLLEKLKKRLKKKDVAVKAYIGSLKNGNLFDFYSKFERKKERALSSEFHQVGSILKPIIYSYYLKNGKNPEDLVSTKELTVNLKSGEWKPREAHDNLPDEVTVAEALMHSYNRPLIRLAQDAGWPALESFLAAKIPRLKVPLAEFPAQLLGAVELSIKEIFEIYRSFIIEECQDWENDKEHKNVLYLMSDPSQTTVRKLVTTQMAQMRFFGKTGTSNSGHNNWFVFFQGDTLGVIWVGLEGR
ncbi:MAG: penicillin-binding protein, partial [Halobacteriovoraceae bacterium]|nr:penicillin-binding protein [Halobacteriovoraceae bacterium]